MADELEQYIEQWLDNLDGDFVVGIEALKFCEHYRAKYPHQFKEWLNDIAPAIVAQLLGRAARARRAAAVRNMHEDDEIDDTETDNWLDVTYKIDADNTRRHLRDCSADDLRFAADGYDSQSKALAFEAAFMRVLAKRVPTGKTVGDVFSNEAIVTARGRLGRKMHA